MDERKYRRMVIALLSAVVLVGLLELAASVYVISQGWSVEIIEESE